MTRIVVFGGAGFLGSSISKAALSKGWHVTSVSRHGQPSLAAQWHADVEWITGDAFDPSSYNAPLARATHVVSTIGVLDYRGALSERKPSRVIDKLGSTLYDTLNELLPIGTKSHELSQYTRLNRDAAICLGNAIKVHENVESFVYVSAAAGFPGIPKRYIDSKREAETYLTQMDKKYRSILFRPGFVFSGDHGFTKPLARVLGLSYALNSSLSGALPIGAAGVKPLSVDRVGAAIVEACDDERISGPVEVHQIEALADVRWRAEMIV